MKYRAACVCFSVLFLLATASPSVAEPEQNAAYDRIMKTGVIRCGYAAYSPIAFLKDANTEKYSGFVPDYLALLAKNLDLKIEYIEDAGYGPQAIEGLKTGRFDVFCTGMNKNAPRGRAVFYTDTLFYSPVYVYVRPDDKRFDKDVSLINKPSITVSTMDGEAADTIATNRFPNAKKFSVPQNSEMSVMYSNVAHKKADVIFSDSPPAEAFNKSNPKTPLRRASDTPVLIYNLGMTVNNTEPKLQAMLNAAIAELHASGQIKEAIKKYDPTMEGYKVPAYAFDKP